VLYESYSPSTSKGPPQNNLLDILYFVTQGTEKEEGDSPDTEPERSQVKERIIIFSTL
jgi:hypothetical protein